MSVFAGRDEKIVFTEVKKIIAHWALQEEPELIRVVENFVYLVKRGEEKFILRVTEKSHRSFEQLEAELEWMDFLHQHNLELAYPIKSKIGKFIHSFEAAGDSYYAALFQFAEGEAPDFEKIWGAEMAKALGSYIAKMHRITQKYDDKKKLRHKWQDNRHVLEALDLIPKSDINIRKAWQRQLDWFYSLKQSQDSYGLIHLDMHAGNYFVDKKLKITAFDFDDCAYQFFMYDIAVTITQMHNNQDYINEKESYKYQDFRADLIQAYLKVHPIDSFWINEIDNFLRLRDLEMFAWAHLMFDFNNLDEHDVAFFKRTRARY